MTTNDDKDEIGGEPVQDSTGWSLREEDPRILGALGIK